MIADADIALRLLLAAALGGLVGFERELRDRAAGFRTHIVVSTGACLFALISAYGFPDVAAGSADLAARADVTRIASQVVVGIGFLGAGVIVRTGGDVQGLTTAASLWLTAAVGVGVGLGFTLGALTATGIAMVTLTLLRPFKRRIARDVRRDEGDERDDEG